MPALKAVLAERTGDPEWERVRPPLTPLGKDARAVVLGTDTGAA